MSQYVDTPTKTFLAGEALAINRLVKLVSNEVVYADATNKPIGVTQSACADAEYVAVRLHHSPGTVKMVANGAITTETVLYGCNDGKVNDTDPGSGIVVGFALQAAAADNDIIEVLPKVTAAF